MCYFWIQNLRIYTFLIFICRGGVTGAHFFEAGVNVVIKAWIWRCSEFAKISLKLLLHIVLEILDPNMSPLSWKSWKKSPAQIAIFSNFSWILKIYYQKYWTCQQKSSLEIMRSDKVGWQNGNQLQKRYIFQSRQVQITYTHCSNMKKVLKMAVTSQFQAKPPGYSWLMSKWTLRPKSSGVQGHNWP